MTLQGTNTSRIFGVCLMSPTTARGNILSSSHLQLPKQLWFLLKKKKTCFPISLRDEQVTCLNEVSQLPSGFFASFSAFSNPSCLMLTGYNPVTVQFFCVWDHTDYHSLPASLLSSSLPSAPSLVPQRIQGFMLLWWAIPKSYAGSQIRIKKSPITGTFVCLLQELGFPALGIKTCLMTELFSGCSALQRDLKIHSPRTNSGAEERRKKKKKSHLQPSALGKQHRESPAQSSPLTPSFL